MGLRGWGFGGLGKEGRGDEGGGGKERGWSSMWERFDAREWIWSVSRLVFLNFLPGTWAGMGLQIDSLLRHSLGGPRALDSAGRREDFVDN